MQRWFTQDSARHTLIRIRPAVEHMCAIYRRLEAMRPKDLRCDQPVEAEYFALVRRLHVTIREIDRHGVRVCDVRRGRIEFPTREAGRALRLCWEIGKETIDAGDDSR